MATVTVSEKGQVVIPAAIRRGLGIKPGTELDFELEGTSIRVSLRQNVPAASIASGYGMLRARSSGFGR
ncbi:MAG TPA: AbrB/MazE/SpoVT family DNA-binding domain-containing protein [Nitrospira sp.]|nr:AbrB/MazE/SpoVT family DNA-binding domain-containing protein [Nitrospira sp.]